MNQNFNRIFTVSFFILSILSAEEFDLFLKNGRVIDGTGNPWIYADVGITGDRIVYVGRIATKVKAKKVVDVRGLTITPGFIDIHSHAYDSFRSFPDDRINAGNLDPEREKKLRPGKNMVAQGVTTLVTNQDGRSGWPISDQIDKLNQGGGSVPT